MSEKMRWSEAESVVRAYRAAHGASADIDVARLADALGTDIAEIRRLASQRRSFTDRSGVLSAGLAMALASAAVLICGARSIGRYPAIAALPAPRASIIYLHRPLTRKIEIHDGTAWISTDGNLDKIGLGDLSKTNDGRLFFHDDEPL